MDLHRWRSWASIGVQRWIVYRFSAASVLNSLRLLCIIAITCSRTRSHLLYSRSTLIIKTPRTKCLENQSQSSCSHGCGFAIIHSRDYGSLLYHQSNAHLLRTAPSHSQECFKYPHQANEIHDKFTKIHFRGPDSHQVHADMSAYRKILDPHQIQCELCLNIWATEDQWSHHFHKSVTGFN